MSRIINALKELGKKTNTNGTAPTGELVEEVIESITDNFDIGGGSEQVFNATYNETTYADIEAAYQADKLINLHFFSIVLNEDSFSSVVRKDNTGYHFYFMRVDNSINSITFTDAYVSSDNTWNASTHSLTYEM